MQEPEYNLDSLRRHRVKKHECLEVINDPLKCKTEEDDSDRGNPRRMYVGKTEAGRTLEVGVEFLEDGNINIYHARKATRTKREESGYGYD